MRKIFTSLVTLSLAAALAAWVQPPTEKPAKTGEKPAKSDDKSGKLGGKTGKPGEKSGKPSEKTAKPTDQTGEGGLKLGGALATDAEKELDRAIAKMGALDQFQADVRQTVEMLGHRFVSEGMYAVAPDFRMRFELTMHHGDTTGTMLQVCDGRVHWSSHKILDSHELMRLDIAEARKTFDKPEFDKQMRDDLVKMLGFSGIVPFMRGLRDSHRFESHEAESLDGKPVYVLEGRPNYGTPVRRGDEPLGQTSRSQQQAAANLPAYVPNKTTLWIGQEDGWPHRCVMETTQKLRGGIQTSITLEFLNPQLGIEPDVSLFQFEPPPGVEVADRTTFIVEQLRLRLQHSHDTEKGKSSDAGHTHGSPLEKSPAGTAAPTGPGPSLKSQPSSRP